MNKINFDHPGNIALSTICKSVISEKVSNKRHGLNAILVAKERNESSDLSDRNNR
jgi:hypothetical protein